jgi:hypothetical protein
MLGVPVFGFFGIPAPLCTKKARQVPGFDFHLG